MAYTRQPADALECLTNLVYLCVLEAKDPERTRELMKEVQKQIDDLVKMHGLDVPKSNIST